MRIGKKPEEDRIVVIKEDPGSGVIPGVLLGVLAGVVAGLLGSPASGRETRTRIQQRFMRQKATVQSQVSKVSEGASVAKSKLPGQHQ